MECLSYVELVCVLTLLDGYPPHTQHTSLYTAYTIIHRDLSCGGKIERKKRESEI
jgi:hypothetical protein